MIPEILIKNKYEARDLLASDKGIAIKRMLSFDNPGGSKPSGHQHVEKVLRLEFHDVSKAFTNFDPPEKEHIKKIVRFSQEIMEEKYDGTLLIHCQAGISRSTAAAYICNCVFMGEGHEEEALADVYSRRDIARPNKLMVQLGDAVLRRGGVMIEVFKKKPMAQNMAY